MKKLFVIGLFLITILALGVDALSLSPNPLSVTAKPTKGFSTSFTVVNDGTTNLSGLSVALTTTELNGFNISFDQRTPFDLGTTGASATKTITITGTIPKNVNTRLSPFSGTVTVSNSQASGSLTLDVTAENQLRLDKFKVKVDGKSESLDDGDKIDEVKPGSKVEFTGDVENLFSDDDDIDINDVTLTITIDGIDDGDDLEEEGDIGDIKADDKESFTVEFEIPDDVEDGDYDVTVLLEGEDDNGAKYKIEWKLTLELAKEKHDIWVTKASVSPTRVGCSRNINVDVSLKNQGTSDEDEVVVRIESAALGIDNEDTTIPELQEGSFDEDTEYSKRYPFTISDKVKSGTYQIIVNAYYDTDTLSASKTLELVVESCEEEVAAEEETTGDVVVVNPPPETTEETTEEEPEIITTPVTETTEGSLLGSNTYLMVLIGAVGVAVIVIIIMIVVLFSMKKKE